MVTHMTDRRVCQARPVLRDEAPVIPVLGIPLLMPKKSLTENDDIWRDSTYRKRRIL